MLNFGNHLLISTKRLVLLKLVGVRGLGRAGDGESEEEEREWGWGLLAQRVAQQDDG